MNLQEALEKLEAKSVTTSTQMLRRWIRQGKIKATLPSKKEGYIIDQESLNHFIAVKEQTLKNVNESSTSTEEYNRGWQDGYSQAKKNRENIISEILRKKEIEFLKKGFYEEQYIYTRKDLAASKKMTIGVDKFLTLLEMNEVTINVIGLNARVENTLEMIDIRYLANPNRRLKTRLRDEFIEMMQDSLNKEKAIKKD
ncbi:hypothetical protein A5881_003876 [Enterococcus termitis]